MHAKFKKTVHKHRIGGPPPPPEYFSNSQVGMGGCGGRGRGMWGGGGGGALVFSFSLVRIMTDRHRVECGGGGGNGLLPTPTLLGLPLLTAAGVLSQANQLINPSRLFSIHFSFILWRMKSGSSGDRNPRPSNDDYIMYSRIFYAICSLKLTE